MRIYYGQHINSACKYLFYILINIDVTLKLTSHIVALTGTSNQINAFKNIYPRYTILSTDSYNIILNV